MVDGHRQSPIYKLNSTIHDRDDAVEDENEDEDDDRVEPLESHS
jgi:hypothetical protein